MQRGIIGRARLLAAATAAVVTLVILPSVASATVVSAGTGSHTQRESWVRYISTFSGSVTPTGSASYNAGSATVFTDDVLTLAFDRTNTTYDISSRGTVGRGVIALSGGVDYAVPAHYISVRISDPRISLASTTDTAAVVSAVVSYDPYETSGPQIVNPTTPTRIDVYTLNLSGSGVFSDRHVETHVDQRTGGAHGRGRERLQRRHQRLLQRRLRVRLLLVLGHALIR